MMEIIRAFGSYRLAPNSPDTDRFARELPADLPFKILEFESGREVNGWIVPKRWAPMEATIRDLSGKLLYDGMSHPLGVIGYSRSFEGRIRGGDLKTHLFFTDAFEDALVYHCDLFYKPFQEQWGFSVTKAFFKTVRDDQEYDVTLKTKFSKGTMKVLEYTLPGSTADTIILNAHNCHAASANDDLSGVAVGIQIMRELAQLPRRRFTYRLIVAPEHFGSIFYLDSLTRKKASQLRCGVFLEMLGTQGPLTLQRSFLGDTLVDRAFLHALKFGNTTWRTDLFRKVVGNDETCWEAAGYDIPFPSLSRSEGIPPFAEYHSSKDTPEIIREDKLQEAARIVMEAFKILENDLVMKRKFRGLVALSNPRYDLYKPFFDPSIPGRKAIDEAAMRWNYLMNCLPRYFDGRTRTLEIAERHELPFRAVDAYVREFEAKGLIKARPAPIRGPAPRLLAPR